jgi:GntR family transcriptional regulator
VTITLDGTDARPISVQIMDEIRRALVRGALGPEDPLPSVRELSSELYRLVSRFTY